MRKNSKDNIFSRLSTNARIAIRNASLIADHLKSEYIEPEHLIVGIFLNENSLASKIALELGFNTKGLIYRILGDIKVDFVSDIGTPREVALSKNTQVILRKAFDWSQKYAHVYVGTEHLLMGILSSSNDFVKDLADRGLDMKAFVNRLESVATYPIGILYKPDSSVFTNNRGSLLGSVGKDLVDLAKQGKLDPLVGRENELSSIVKVLSRRKKNNPIVVGDAGVGKTILVEGLAQMIADGKVPPSLRDMRIVSLDIPSILAGSKMRGDVEEKIIEIVNEVIESNNTILFIDEIHNILSNGMLGGNSEIASVLKPALLKDDFRCIGATTTDEYTMYFESDNALARRFQPIFLKEPSIEESIQILSNLRPILEAHHNINISEEALKVAVTLSDRYISDRYLPDKAIDLLDEASATKRLTIEGEYQEISTLVGKLRSIQNARDEYILRGRMESAAKLKAEEDLISIQIKSLEEKRDSQKRRRSSTVNVDDVRRVVSEWTGIPLNTLGVKERSSLLKLEERISSSVIGQKDAIESVVSAIKRARTGISDEDRPWASFLFLGPTGVGKTELAKVLAKDLFGNEDKLVQIDMSELMEMHSVSKLIGSPPGYIGYQEGGWLTEKVRRNPHSVILFDEIEKAHPDVLNILLQILEYGHLMDGRGRRVNFKNTIVILTSNIGAEEISRDRVLGFSKDKTISSKAQNPELAYNAMKSELLKELRKTLRPELLNRLDDIVIFRSLNSRDARKILDILLFELNGRLEGRNIKISLSKELTSYIVKEGFSEEYGARPLRRALQDTVEGYIANYILRNSKGGDILLDIKGGKVFADR